MLDLSAILGPLLAGGNPYLIAGGALAVMVWNRLIAKQLTPTHGPAPTPTPSPAPTPTPAPTGRPLLDAIARILGGFLNKPAPSPVVPPAVSPGPVPTLADLSIADVAKLRADCCRELAGRPDNLRKSLAEIATPEPFVSVGR